MKSPPGSRERIIAFGAQGAGKTRAWLDVARMHQLRGSDAVFHVFDTDDAVGDMIYGERFRDLNNVHTMVCTQWSDFEEGLEKIRSEIRPYHDWIVCDLADKPWSAATAHYVRDAYGMSLHQLLIQQRHETTAAGAKPKSPQDPHRSKFGGLEGGEWSEINSFYLPWAQDIFLTVKTHVFFACPLATVDDRADAQTKAMYGRFGVKPVGNKHLGYQARTVLKFDHFGDQRTMVTVKDRERTQLSGEPIGDFAISYLKNIGGWEL